MKPYGLKQEAHSEPLCDCDSAIRKVFCVCDNSKRIKRRNKGAKRTSEKIAYKRMKGGVRQKAKRTLRETLCED
jgi:hypothetical protein